MTDIRRFVVDGSSEPDEVVATCVVALGLKVMTDETFVRTFLDTPSRALAADRTGLEHRRPEGSDRAASLWWTADGRTLALDDCVSNSVPTTVEEVSQAPAFDRLRERVDPGPLVAGPVASTRLVTLARLDDEGKTTARVIVDASAPDDRSSIDSNPTMAPAVTVTVEIVALRGFADEAAEVDAALRRALRLEPTTTSVRERLVRATKAAMVPSGSSASSVAGAAIDPAMTAGEAWRASLRALTARFDAELEGALAGADAEHLHRLRVAVRRVRTLLVDGEDVIDDSSRRMFRRDFQWLGDVTTPTRDADVHLEQVPVLIAGLEGDRRSALLPFLDVLRAERTNRHTRMVLELRSERFAALRSEWASFLADDDAWSDRRAGSDAGRRAVRVVGRRIGEAHRRLERDGGRITKKSEPERLHDLRKRAKHLRYLLECFGPLFDADDVEVVMVPLRNLQGVLGEFQDSEVQAAELRELARDVSMSREGRRALDEVLTRVERRGREARRAFAGSFDDLDRRPVRRSIERIASTKGPKGTNGRKGSTR